MTFFSCITCLSSCVILSINSSFVASSYIFKHKQPRLHPKNINIIRDVLNRWLNHKEKAKQRKDV